MTEFDSLDDVTKSDDEKEEKEDQQEVIDDVYTQINEDDFL